MNSMKKTMLIVMISMASVALSSCVNAVYCTSATGACYFHFTTGAAQNSAIGYTTHPLDSGNGNIVRAVIVIHGTDRTAGHYFETMAGVANSHKLLDKVIIVAPHFICAQDKPAAGDLYWTCENWKDGGPAVNDASVYSFTVIDKLVEKLRSSFPNLTSVVITGHSAGGQFVQRYAASNNIDVIGSGFSVKYIPANPSSYMYLDERRLKKSAVCVDETDCVLTLDSFEKPYWNADSSAECGKYNRYKYGLDDREGYYIGPLTSEQIVTQYVGRDVVYLLGNKDNSKDSEYSELDKSCPGDAEGPYMGPDAHPFRLQRGLAFHAYMTGIFSAGHVLQIVPGCMHDEVCMYQSNAAFSVIFQ